MEPDFSGWATKANLKCADGRTISAEAFLKQDGMQVPLVWQHSHNSPGNVLGYAILHAKPEGMWAEGFFNDTDSGKQAKALVQHKDVDSMSIYANELVERAISGAKTVLHGVIREVSLVLSGANPGAKIMHVSLAHDIDGLDDLDDEAVIFTGESLYHSEDGKPAEEEQQKEQQVKTEQEQEEQVDNQAVYDSMSNEQKELLHSMLDDALEISDEAESNGGVLAHVGADATLQDVFDSFTEDQKKLVFYMIGVAMDSAAGDNSAAHSGITNEGDLIHQEGNTMRRNVFEQNGETYTGAQSAPSLSHDALKTIFATAQKDGSLKDAFLEHADSSLGYGIDDIEFLFPDAKSVTSQPELIARRTEWVAGILDGAKHSPFSRIKSLAADLTADEARAKGYVKGNLKKDEVIKLLKRVTLPTTVYKKQRLDRDDIIDITDLDVVAWLKWEMKFMLEEEIARAILIGDGREPDDDDKIDEDSLRPIAWDDDMYSHKVNLPANVVGDALVESVIRARKYYKGTGTPTFYTTDDILTDMLLIKDKVGRRVYPTVTELSATLRVKDVVVVEVLESAPDLLGIMVNIADYTIGADKGGQLAMFDDFDIDYNQRKYLMETRISGALTKPKSAVVVKRDSGTTVTPTTPTFDPDTNTLTVPNTAGVEYWDVTDVTNETKLTAGNTVITRTTDVEARALTGYNFPHNTDTDWTFAYTA